MNFDAGLFEAVFWALVALSAAAAAIYGFVFLNRPPSPARALVKTLFMAPLAVAFVLAQAPVLLIAGIVASAFGDCFLAFDKKWTVPAGIGAFLLAQLCYLALFVTYAHADDPLTPRYLAMGAIAATVLVFLLWLWPKLGQLAFGVVPYSLAIGAMAIASFMLPWANAPVMAGAISFVVSDGVISAELFKLAPDAPARRITAPVVWWTYVAAQLLITLGFWGGALVIDR